VAAEPNRLYASGDRALPAQPVIRRNHPFLDAGDVASAVEERMQRPSTLPMFPVMTGARSPEAVSFPVYRPNAR
jgi:hypothetical protein